MAHEFTDVVDTIFDHGGTFEGKAPAEDANILGETEGTSEFGAEHARVTDLDPFLKTSMVGEDFHRRFGIGVVGGLEADITDAHFGKEGIHEADKVTEGGVPVGDNTLDLVELGKMGGVNGLVPEDTIDGEILDGMELGLLGEMIEHVGADGGGVGTKDELFSL